MKKTKYKNGLRYPEFTREIARKLRQQGQAYKQIAKILGISVSTIYQWTQGIILSSEQKNAIQAKRDRAVWTSELRARVGASVRRARLGQYRYTKEELLERISEFFRRYGRIPLKREFNMYETYKRQFGSWNAAIQAAGFSSNPVLFAKKFIAADGHHCDSFTEKIIDDWFYNRGILHQRHWRYGETKMTADFFIEPDIVVEFFGLADVQDGYNIIMERKRDFCARNYLQLIEIYPDDIFPENRLSAISEKLTILAD